MAIGERLRDARMRQKIDIADVEAATKIRAKYLRALENEEFGLLPGNTFVKTFLRTYAEHLGLDPQLLLEEYRAEYEPRSAAEIQPYVPPARRRNQRERPRRRAAAGPPGPGTALLVIVGVVLVIFAILGLTSGGSNNNSGSNQAKKQSTQPQQSKKPKKKPARPRVTRVKLRVVPSGPTYVCIDRGIGTPVVYQGTTSSGQSFRGKHLRINAGNSRVRLSANGKRVKVPLGATPIGYDFQLKKGKVVTTPIPLGQRPCG